MVVGIEEMASVSKVCVVTNFHSTAWEERKKENEDKVRKLKECIKNYKKVEGEKLI